MNKEMKKQLETVINATVNEDVEAAQKAFHAYLTAKTQEILSEKEEEDEDDDKDEDEDDKKPAFLKKSKKD